MNGSIGAMANERTCGVEGCERPFKARGMCNMHWRRASKAGTLATAPRELALSVTAPRVGACQVDGCTRPHDAKGYCRQHYARWVRTGDPQGVTTSHGEPLRWLTEAIKQQTDGCIVWPFPTDVHGYGHVTVEGKTVVASRYVCELTYGLPALGQVAAHAPVICHNPACVNPRHLRWTSQRDNVADSFIDGTFPQGSRHGQARLTEDDVRAIRTAAESGESRASIARRYGLGPSTVTMIVLRKAWSWLP